MRILLLLIASCVLLCSGIYGCGGTQRAAPPPPSPLRPDWTTNGVRQHLRFFANSEDEGRIAGIGAAAVSAAYIAARMEEFNLQPALANQFQIVYPSTDLALDGAALFLVGGDTTFFLPGTDFLPDGRSSFGALRAEAVTLDPLGQSVDDPGPAVLMPVAKATTPYLQRVREEGARTAFVVGPLAPRQVALPIEGLLVVQLTSLTAARITGMQVDSLVGKLDLREDLEGAYEPIQLHRAIGVRVDERALPAAEGLALLSYGAGKHPVLSRELVIVCADLDASGISVAALLEAARQVGHFSRLWPLPERTVLFAVWAGSRTGRSGLGDYLQRSLWALDRIHSVVYIDLNPEAEPEVRDLLDSLGRPLVSVDSDSLAIAATTTSEGPQPLEASAVALALAQKIYSVTFREAVTPEAFFSLDGDSLRIPEAAR